MTYRLFTIPAGTHLYHGSRTVGERIHPDGPAWFAWAKAGAYHWGRWGDAPPEGRIFGDLKIYTYRVTSPLPVANLEAASAWHATGMEFFGHEDFTPYSLANEFQNRGLYGWTTQNEVLVVQPSRWFELIDTETIPPGVKL